MQEYKKIPLRPVNPNNPVIKAYVKAMQAGEKMYYMSQNDGKWKVKKAKHGTKRSKTFDDKQEARIYGEKLAKKDQTELIIFGENGRIEDRISFLKI